MHNSTPDGPEAVSWLRKSLVHVNRVLRSNDLPEHVEPEELPELVDRGLLGFPYSWLHYLRWAVAYARQAPNKFGPLPAERRLQDRGHVRIGRGWNEMQVWDDKGRSTYPLRRVLRGGIFVFGRTTGVLSPSIDHKRQTFHRSGAPSW